MSATEKEIKKIFDDICDFAATKGHPDIRNRGWVLVFNNSKTALGICNYGERTIGISKHFMKYNDVEELRNTVSHEIAHAIAGSQEGHGPKWKRIHGSLGGDGNRLAVNAKSGGFKWHLIRKDTGEFIHGFHRKPSRNYSVVQLKGSSQLIQTKLVKVV